MNCCPFCNVPCGSEPAACTEVSRLAHRDPWGLTTTLHPPFVLVVVHLHGHWSRSRFVDVGGLQHGHRHRQVRWHRYWHVVFVGGFNIGGGVDMSVNVLVCGVCRWRQHWSSTQLVDKSRRGWAMTWHHSMDGIGAVMVVNFILLGTMWAVPEAWWQQANPPTSLDEEGHATGGFRWT